MSDTTWQSEFFADRTDTHPWYGPCDANTSDGGCAECAAVLYQPGYADVKRSWWQSSMAHSAVDAERRARRRERKRAKLEASW